MEPVVIVAAKRTAVASFQGVFSTISAPHLGAVALRACLENSGVAPEEVDECIMGEVLCAGVGQAPARQAAIYAGLPTSTACLTINKVCGSGLKAIMLAANSIQLEESKIVLAGGQENMTQAPHLLENSRTGYRMGNTQMVDSLIKDGLWDPYHQFHMGVAAELCVKEKNFTREAQDLFAQASYEKALHAQSQGLFANEIAPVEIQDKKGNTRQVLEDEEPRNANFEKMKTLKPAFEKSGTITAANASKLNDGAAAVLLMRASEAKKRNLKPLAKIIAQATFAQDPKLFTTAPIGAIKKSLTHANLKISDIDAWEINEAFSVVAQVAIRELEIPPAKVNMHGGAIALGHPIGASGARIFTTLLSILNLQQKRYGLATLCIGGGEAVAVVVERS